jgi:hypothetical protein
LFSPFSTLALSLPKLLRYLPACAETRNGRINRWRWVPWAQLLLKVFSVEVMVCPRCDSRM